MAWPRALWWRVAWRRALWWPAAWRRALWWRAVWPLVAAASFAAGACNRSRGAPDSEMLLVTGDSTFWLTAEGGGVRVRGVPMLVARIEGRFKELYVTDDDRSYYDAVFVGHRLFVRDLLSGDSTELNRDTTVARLASEYGIAHPDEQRLGPDDPENDDAAIRATSDLGIVGVHGPYLSYEHRLDVEASGEVPVAHRHASRRGVLDARTGALVSVAALFGRAAADAMIPSAQAEWRAARDTLLAAAGDTAATRVRRALSAFHFDPMSFTIGASGRDPTVRFAVPVSGAIPDLDPVALAQRPVAAPGWWQSVTQELPVAPGEAGTWASGSDTIVVRVDDEARSWLIAFRRGTAAAPPSVRVSSAVERVLWLDGTVTAADRAALMRAFAEASGYDGERQVAALAPAAAPVHLASHDRSTASPPRFGVPPRVVGPDDAAGREHPRPRIRRGYTRNARQDRIRGRDAALPDALRHGIG